MSLLNLFSNQLSKVIQWENQSPALLWYRFPSKQNEIKNASKLIVAPGQGCILVYEGKIADIIDTEGIYNLKTDNHPFITTLLNLRQNFESEHKLYVYFYRKAQVVNQAWGTATPVKYVDAVYNIPIEMGANGNFSYSIANPKFFYTEIIGSKESYTTDEMRTVVADRIPQLIATALSERRYSYQEIDAQLHYIAQQLLRILNESFTTLGLQLTDFRITGTQFDEKTQERIGRVADISTDVKAAGQAGLDYADLEKLRALRDAARNEGGLAGAGVQFGAGMELGKKLNQQTDDILSKSNTDTVEKLRKLKLLLDENIITPAEFEEKKKELLGQL
ncbi:SPFH domain-containing protein [Niabella beijingensis]|uniref:SPFH domain-containing protein n=1 Tax=Niabella beijingensis TaxID=2872700 RepID=UPI001CBE5919|nr:SPFH domain-containing protein [Niabella beijingensis]MBZ4190110.1 SPFH domain-containing protein [Niabella beijingensis]